MGIFQILYLALAGRFVVEHDARPHIAALGYGVACTAVGIGFGDAILARLLAGVLGGVLTYGWLLLLRRAQGLWFLPAVASCILILWGEGWVMDLVS